MSWEAKLQCTELVEQPFLLSFSPPLLLSVTAYSLEHLLGSVRPAALEKSPPHL